MRRILRKEKTGYALGLMFCLAGLVLLSIVLVKAWPHVSVSQSLLSELLSYLWTTEELDFLFGVGFKLMYFAILGVVMLLFGIIGLVLSRRWFTLSGETVLLRCPYCKNNWRANRAKGWAECPHCRKFIQSQVMKKG